MKRTERKQLHVLGTFMLGAILVAAMWIARTQLTHTWFYGFLLWNLFLAFVPLAISHHLENGRSTSSLKWWCCFLVWVLFFPNAPYIITDLIHLRSRGGIPLWYDAAMVFTAALTGLWAGCLSLLQMERQWRKRVPIVKPIFFVAAMMLLCGFGIYLGRVLRFNSWDVITDPVSLLKVLLYRLRYPWDHMRTWAVTVLFATMLAVAYRQVKLLTLHLHERDGHA